jgi:hypothetical protein
MDFPVYQVSSFRAENSLNFFVMAMDGAALTAMCRAEKSGSIQPA